MSRLIVAATLLLVAAPASGTGVNQRTEQTIRTCETMIDALHDDLPREGWVEGTSFGFCMGWVRGILDVVDLGDFVGDPYIGKILGCRDNVAVTPERAARIFLRYVEEHPERRHESDLLVFSRAMRDAFPCGEKEEGAP